MRYRRHRFARRNAGSATRCGAACPRPHDRASRSRWPWRVDEPMPLRRPRSPPSGDHRPLRGGGAADACARSDRDHLQRRNLQLPGAARDAPPWSAFPVGLRYRVHSRRLRASRRRLPRSPARHVRLRDLGRPPQGAVLRPRPLRHQAVLLCDGRQFVCVCLGGEGAGAVSAGDRNRPRGARRIPDVPIHAWRSDAVSRREAVAAGPCADHREGAGQGLAILGRPLRHRFRAQ